MAVDLPDLSEAAVQGVERLAQHLMIGPVIDFDPAAQLGDRQPAVVHLQVRRTDSPDQAVPEARLFARLDRPRPTPVDELGVDIGRRAVRIDVAAWEMRREQRGAEFRCRREKLIDIHILRPPHGIHRHDGIEIVRVFAAAMRRIEHHRRRRTDRIPKGKNAWERQRGRLLLVH